MTLPRQKADELYIFYMFIFVSLSWIGINLYLFSQLTHSLPHPDQSSGLHYFYLNGGITSRFLTLGGLLLVSLLSLRTLTTLQSKSAKFANPIVLITGCFVLVALGLVDMVACQAEAFYAIVGNGNATLPRVFLLYVGISSNTGVIALFVTSIFLTLVSLHCFLVNYKYMQVTHSKLIFAAGYVIYTVSILKFYNIPTFNMLGTSLLASVILLSVFVLQILSNKDVFSFTYLFSPILSTVLLFPLHFWMFRSNFLLQYEQYQDSYKQVQVMNLYVRNVSELSQSILIISIVLLPLVFLAIFSARHELCSHLRKKALFVFTAIVLFSNLVGIGIYYEVQVYRLAKYSQFNKFIDMARLW